MKNIDRTYLDRLIRDHAVAVTDVVTSGNNADSHSWGVFDLLVLVVLDEYEWSYNEAGAYVRKVGNAR